MLHTSTALHSVLYTRTALHSALHTRNAAHHSLVCSGAIETAEEAIAFVEANKVPYPVLIKAAFGGGGRGEHFSMNQPLLLPC